MLNEMESEFIQRTRTPLQHQLAPSAVAGASLAAGAGGLCGQVLRTGRVYGAFQAFVDLKRNFAAPALNIAQEWRAERQKFR
jgi:hypothetical protein